MGNKNDARGDDKLMFFKLPCNYKLDHGPFQSGPYSCVRDLLAKFALNFSLIAK